MKSLTIFRPGYVETLLYMLQASEYQPGMYLKWFWRIRDWDHVVYRGNLDNTQKIRILRLIAIGWILLQTVAGLLVFAHWFRNPEALHVGVLALVIFLSTPVVLAHILVIPLTIGYYLVQRPQEKKLFAQAQPIYAKHPGTVIAIAGSFGKTTLKDLLATVLAEERKVAVTPGNLNTPIALSRFAKQLLGDEDFVVLEYGEFKPDDILQFCELTSPDVGIITGVNQAHLDNFKTVEQAAKNIFHLAECLNHKQVYVNGDNEVAKARSTGGDQLYSQDGVGDWKITNVKTGLDGTSFTLTNGNDKLSISSGLIGRHQVGPLALSAVLAHQFGLSKASIEAGLRKTKPVEHRLQPRKLGDVDIIDDTYNGNIDGITVALTLVKELNAARKVYITPGLVEQGEKTPELHHQIGDMAAEVFDVIYLVKNSVTDYIVAGLALRDFTGEIHLVDHPKEFYENLESITKSGDLVLMQNDWTDNYH